MVKLEIKSVISEGLGDKTKWVLDCAYCSACDECDAITSAECNQHIYLCVRIKNITDSQANVSCYYRLYKDGKDYYKSEIKTKKIAAGSTKQFFSHGIHLLGDLCADWKALVVASIVSCEETCETTCQTTCEATCQTTCEETCQSTCEVSCQTTCEKTCQTTCEGVCQTTCQTTCQSACERACQTACEGTCQTTCETTCERTCQTACEVSSQLCQTSCEEFCQLLEEMKCPIMVVSYGTPLVDSLEPLRRIRKILPSLILRIYYSDLHLKIARKLRRFLYLPLLILTKLINYISKQH